MFFRLASENPVLYVSIVLGVMLSIVLHELGHGFAAIRQGDDTPRLTGHITWNPMVHMGGMAIAMLCIIGISYGAMPVNPARFRSRYGQAIVAFAGPAVNLALALLSLTILGLWLRFGGPIDAHELTNAHEFLLILGKLNLVLFVFNLLPLPPLDGSTVLANLSPGFRRLARNPNNQPMFMGALILFVIFAGRFLFPMAEEIALGYIGLLLG